MHLPINKPPVGRNEEDEEEEEDEEMFISVNPLTPPSVYLSKHTPGQKEELKSSYLSMFLCAISLSSYSLSTTTLTDISAHYYWKSYCYKSVTCKDIAIDDCKKVLFCASCVKTTKKRREEPCMFLALEYSICCICCLSSY